MSVYLSPKSSHRALSSGVDSQQQLVCLLPCSHKVQRIFAENHYGKMIKFSCELKDRNCGVCNEKVVSYIDSGPDGDPHYYFPPAVFVLKNNDWDLTFSKEGELCREMRFVSKTDHSELKGFALLGYYDGSVRMSVSFRENMGFDEYLLSCKLICLYDGFYMSKNVQELRDIFRIISNNSVIPDDQLMQMREIVERGACNPTQTFEDWVTHSWLAQRHLGVNPHVVHNDVVVNKPVAFPKIVVTQPLERPNTVVNKPVAHQSRSLPMPNRGWHTSRF
jgi:hypothetical protein